MDNKDITFLLLRAMDNLSEAEKYEFDNVLHHVSTWNKEHRININFLQNNLNMLIALMWAAMKTSQKTIGKTV